MDQATDGTPWASYNQGIGIDKLVSVVEWTGQSAPRTRYYHADAIGSVRSLTDEGAGQVGTYAYDAWGNVTASSGAEENEYKFTSRRWEAAAGLQYNRARFYDPAIGRFISPDPLTGGPDDPTISYFGGLYSAFHRFLKEYVDALQPDKLNRYAYCYNNPVNLIDPLGLDSYVITWAQGDLAHQEQAKIMASQFCASDYFDPSQDAVYLYPVDSVPDIAKALSLHDDKAAWVYVGHADKQALFPSLSRTTADSNLSESGGSGDNFKYSTSVRELSTEGFIDNAAIILAGCRTRVGENSIAQSIADHFELRTLASGSGVSWRSSGPVSTLRQIFSDWKKGKGELGGFQWVYPKKDVQIETSDTNTKKEKTKTEKSKTAEDEKK